MVLGPWLFDSVCLGPWKFVFFYVPGDLFWFVWLPGGLLRLSMSLGICLGSYSYLEVCLRLSMLLGFCLCFVYFPGGLLGFA